MTMIDNGDDDSEGLVFDMAAACKSWSSRPTLEQRLADEERRIKSQYFMKWLNEAGVIAFLDFLIGDAGTMPDARHKATTLRHQLIGE